MSKFQQYRASILNEQKVDLNPSKWYIYNKKHDNFSQPFDDIDKAKENWSKFHKEFDKDGSKSTIASGADMMKVHGFDKHGNRKKLNESSGSPAFEDYLSGKYAGEVAGRDSVQVTFKKGGVGRDAYLMQLSNPNRGGTFYPVGWTDEAAFKASFQNLRNAIDKAENEAMGDFKKYRKARDKFMADLKSGLMDESLDEAAKPPVKSTEEIVQSIQKLVGEWHGEGVKIVEDSVRKGIRTIVIGVDKNNKPPLITRLRLLKFSKKDDTYALQTENSSVVAKGFNDVVIVRLPA